MGKQGISRTERRKTVVWAIKSALSINAKVFILWIAVSTIVSLLPTVSVILYQKIISQISGYLNMGEGHFYNCFVLTIGLGIVHLMIGLSNRINKDLIYMVMYDYYHIGMQEKIMECVRNVDIKTLRSKEYANEYKAMLNRAGALNDFMVSMCLLIAKAISVVSMLFVLADVSLALTGTAILYTVGVIVVNRRLAIKTQFNKLKVIEEERKLELMQKQVAVSGVAKEIRIFGNKDKIYEQWDTEYGKLASMERKVFWWRAVLSLLSGLLFYVFMIVVIGYSVFRVSQGAMTVDVFLLLFTLGQNMTKTVQALAETTQMSEGCLFNLNMQRKFIENVPSVTASREYRRLLEEEKAETAICVKNVSFSYNDQQEVLHDISFSIQDGETVALVGCNGSGKSTLVKLLTNVYKPNEGTIKLYGKEYDTYSQNEIPANMGVFFQDSSIYHASIRENIGFGDVKHINSESHIKRAMHLGGAEKIVNRFEDGMEHWLMRYAIKEGAVLSGGESQKITIARAYMSDKPIMIFDEPASALDPIAEMEQFMRIKEELHNRTAILISHRVSFARLADRILVLDQGHLVENGTHEQLMEADGVYAKFFREQAQWYDV